MKSLSIAVAALGFVLSKCPLSDGAAIKKFAVAQRPTRLAPGLNGGVWFSAENPPSINQMDKNGGITQVLALPAGTRIGGIASTPDGGLWFTTYEFSSGRTSQPRIQLIQPDGTMKRFRTRGDVAAFSIASDKGGVAWFTQQKDSIGRIDADGNMAEYPLPELPSGKYNAAWAIASDGNDMWVTTMKEPAVIRIGATGDMERHPIDWTGAMPRAISAGNSGVWFSDVSASGNLGRIDKEGKMYRIPIPKELGEAPIGIALVNDEVWIAGLAYVAKMSVEGLSTKLPAGFGQSITTTADGRVWVSATITNFGAYYFKKPFVGAIWRFDEK